MCAGRVKYSHHAAGVTICQLGWVGRLVLPPQARLPGITVMILAEVMVPVWAQSAGMAPWHPRHIAVRYELFPHCARRVRRGRHDRRPGSVRPASRHRPALRAGKRWPADGLRVLTWRGCLPCPSVHSSCLQVPCFRLPGTPTRRTVVTDR
ncbi:low temperature requirement protein A [Streptomyces flaveolus]|uniref:low temperature requirement protein A n=1 Tax=Streptomyces flaveolus TaxID=67297 RepID=UPI0036ADC147